MDLGFAVKYDIQNLKQSGKITDNQMHTFKQGDNFWFNYVPMHHKKSPLNSLISRCSKCLSPLFTAECAESCEIILCTVADDAKGQCRKF